MPIEAVLFIIGGMLGFVLGYWVRAGMSWRRHKRAVQRKMDSVAAPTAREPQFTLLSPAEQNSGRTSQDNRVSSGRQGSATHVVIGSMFAIGAFEICVQVPSLEPDYPGCS